MIRMYLIRHGSTPGNREHRYIGRTEEDLCEEGILALKGQEAPEVQRIYAVHPDSEDPVSGAGSGKDRRIPGM